MTKLIFLEISFLFCFCPGKTKKDLNIAVQMMKRIYSLLEKYPELLQEEDQMLIAKCLIYLGFDELASSLCQIQVRFFRIAPFFIINYWI